MAGVVARGQLHGRDGEIARCDASLRDAIEGRGQVLLVTSETGFGKTSLLAHIARASAATGATVLRASGDETEVDLPFGVLDQLVPQGAGAERADHAGVSERGTWLVDVWSELTERAPLVVLVDDAEWADPSSLAALTFALRRVHVDRVLAVVACEPSAVETLPAGLRRLAAGDSGDTISLSGLDRSALTALLRDAGQPVLTAEAVERLRSATDGNPLHVLALARELTASELEGDLSTPLPAPRSIATALLSTIGALSHDAIELTNAVAVLGSGCRFYDASRLAELDDTRATAALDAARSAGVLEEDLAGQGFIVRFAHPFARSAVYHDLRPEHAAALHERAATIVDNDRDALRHQILAGDATDDSLAARAEVVADTLARQGAFVEGASWLELAARATASTEERERRQLSSVLYRVYGGAAYPDELDKADAVSDSPLRLVLAGSKAVIEARFLDGEALLRAAWERVDNAAEPELAARIALRLADALHGQGNPADAIEYSRRAVVLTPGGERLLGEDPLSTHLYGAAMSDMGEAAALVAERFPAGRVDASTPGLLGRAAVRMLTDDTLGALQDIIACVDYYRRVGPPHKLVESMALLVEIRYRRSDWDACVVDAETARALALEGGVPQLSAFIYALSIGVPAARGNYAAAEELLALGREQLAIRGSYEAVGQLWLGEARIGAAARDHDRVLAALETIAMVADAMPLLEVPNALPWRLAYGTALVGIGDAGRAELCSDRLTTSADRVGLPAARGGAARLRGLVATLRDDIDSAVDELTDAAALFREAAMPFEAALADLDQGSALRRAGKRREAAERLQSARFVLDRLHATPYLERCDQELASCGLRHQKRSAAHPSPDLAGLTPAETAVLELVRQGKSNRETASALVISVRTVEHHVGQIYSKLGVSSRSQLVALLAEQRDPS